MYTNKREYYRSTEKDRRKRRIGVTLNTYTHLGLEDAAEELRRMEEAENARREQEKLASKAKDAQKLFKAV